MDDVGTDVVGCIDAVGVDVAVHAVVDVAVVGNDNVDDGEVTPNFEKGCCPYQKCLSKSWLDMGHCGHCGQDCQLL